MRILVTGSEGFIGKHVVAALKEEGHQVHSCDPKLNYKVQDIDILGLEPMDYIIHLGASHVISNSIINPIEFYKNNLESTLAVLAISRQFKAPIVFASSAAVYAPRYNIPPDLRMEWHEKAPSNPYGFSKMWCEQMLHDHMVAYNIPHVILRLFNVAGPGYETKPSTHIIPTIVNCILDNKPLLIYDDNLIQDYDTTCIRDYVHVRDVADAFCNSIEFLEDHKQCITANIGSGQSTSIMDLLRRTKTLLGVSPDWEYVGSRPGEPRRLVANSELAKTYLEWKPQYNVADMIVEAYEWEKSRREH